MKRIPLLLFLIFLSSSFLWSQFSETIRTGRPGQSIGPYTVGQSVFQVQSGFNYNEVEAGIDFSTKTLLHNTVIRYGILEKLELSAVVNWQTDENITIAGSDRNTGISNTQIGFRYNFRANEGAKPAIGFQGRILLKAQSEIYQRENLGATFILITGNKLSDRFSLISNWGLTWAGNGASGRLFYALNLSYSLSEKWGTFLEMYGDLNNFNANVDTGLSFLVSEDVMLDASTGWQGDNNLNDWFVDLGISFRFHNRD